VWEAAVVSLVGETVRSIRVVELLGEGGMGEVYLGDDQVLKRQVALKVIRAGKRMDDHARARFLREAQILSQLEHPNICGIHDFIAGNEHDIIVLEHVKGVSLRQAWQDGLSRSEKLSIASQAADVLVAAHSMSVVHRDLKPENIMVTADNQVKVLDFGLARPVVEESPVGAPQNGSPTTDSTGRTALTDTPDVTQHGGIVGTPRYMSPEQARGEPVTASSDMYSFGLVLQELFTEESPFGEDRPHHEELRRALWGESEPVKGLDRQLAKLIEQLKSFFPKDRPSAVATANRLRWIADAPRRRRNKIVVATVWTVLLALSAGLAVQSIRQTRAAEQARREAETARRVAAFMVDVFQVPDPWREGAGDVSAREILDQGAERIKSELADEPEVRAAFLHTIGDVFHGLGDYEQCETFARDALDIRRRVLGPRHPDVAASLSLLGSSLNMIDECEEAERCHREAYEINRSHYGDDHPAVAENLARIAQDLRCLGDYSAAQRTGLEALAIMKRTGRNTDTEVVRCLRGLGANTRMLGRPRESEEFLQEALDVAVDAFGESHAEVMLCADQLALALLHQGQYSEAEEKLRTAVEIGERVLGASHPDVMSTRRNLAHSLFKLGRYAEAEELQRRVLEFHRHEYDDQHMAVVTSKNNLAVTLYHLGRYAEAEPLMLEVQAALRAGSGKAHPRVGYSLNNLALVCDEQGRHEEAETALREALEIERSALGDEHPRIADSLNRLGIVLRNQGRLDEAAKNIQQALEMRRGILGPDHPDVAAALRDLASVLLEQGRDSEAERLAGQAVDLGRSTVGGSHPSLGFSLAVLARALVRLERCGEAEALAREAVTIVEASLPDDHAELAICRGTVGLVLVCLDRLPEAESVLTRAMAVLETSGGFRFRSQSLIGDLSTRIEAVSGSGRSATIRGMLDPG
jgi:tetratricopeptide (TPR) repeat protein/tRNA A-37 threonylcarbamoyl transferase component Bud32